MSAADWLCVVWFAAGLLVLGVAMFRQAYRRAHPKRRPPFLTGWEDGR